MNLPELVDYLRSVEETTLLELLHLNSSDIMDAFAERVEEYEDEIRGMIDE